MEEQRSPGKPFGISRWEVQRAWEKVRANKGAPGVHDVSVAGFEKDLKAISTRSGTGCRRGRTSRRR